MDELKPIETEQQKKQRKTIDLFVNPKVRGVYYNDYNRWFLDRRQYFIAKKIIKYLGENGSSKKTDVLQKVTEDYNKNLKPLFDKYGGNVAGVLKSPFFFIIKRKNKSKEYKYVYLSISDCRYILQNLTPLLVKCHEKRTKGKHSTMIYELNSKGHAVYRKLMEVEENVSTQMS